MDDDVPALPPGRGRGPRAPRLVPRLRGRRAADLHRVPCAPSTRGSRCPPARRWARRGPPHPLLQLEWCAPFGGTLRRALHALKYAGERRLARPLGEAVARRWRAAGAGGDLLVPIPVHASRRRERGYDQAELIAAAAAAALPLPWLPALERTRATTAQYHLDRHHRAANVDDAFGVRPEAARAIRGRWIVLVDDVVTTGSTLCAAGEALLAAGATAVSAITVARER